MKGMKHTWTKSWTPSDIVQEPDTAGTTEHGMLRGLGRASAHAGHTAYQQIMKLSRVS